MNQIFVKEIELKNEQSHFVSSLIKARGNYLDITIEISIFIHCLVCPQEAQRFAKWRCLLYIDFCLQRTLRDCPENSPCCFIT